MLTDEELAQRVQDGDEAAFVALVRRHERPLVALIRGRIYTDDAVPDVLQETLLQVWTGLRRRRTPERIRPWILQVARNRCSDYLRSRQRRDMATEIEHLEPLANRHGIAASRLRERAGEVVEAFDEVSELERAALRSFYLDGLSIAEISARHRCPPGTIKRRLSHGRDQLRTFMGVVKERKPAMSKHTAFPAVRPDISITPSQSEPFSIDFKELAWWFLVPEPECQGSGNQVRWASYDPPIDGQGPSTPAPWPLASWVHMEVVAPATIHDRNGLEISVCEQLVDREGDVTPASDKTRHTRMFARLTDTEVEWLGVESRRPDGGTELRTFLDDSFLSDWGSTPRTLADQGVLQELSPGVFELPSEAREMLLAGSFDVVIGEQTFPCMRVFNIEHGVSERDILIEAYLTRSGRTALFRRYEGNLWGKREKGPQQQGTAPTWAEDLPSANRIVVNGMTFVHHYDSLPDFACGVAD